RHSEVDDAELPQIAQQRRHRPRPGNSAPTSTASGSAKRLDPLLVELAWCKLLGPEPPPDLAQLLEHVAHRARRVATLRQPRPVALHMGAQQTRLPPRS